MSKGMFLWTVSGWFAHERNKCCSLLNLNDLFLEFHSLYHWLSMCMIPKLALAFPLEGCCIVGSYDSWLGTNCHKFHHLASPFRTENMFLVFTGFWNNTEHFLWRHFITSQSNLLFATYGWPLVITETLWQIWKTRGLGKCKLIYWSIKGSPPGMCLVT